MRVWPGIFLPICLTLFYKKALFKVTQSVLTLGLLSIMNAYALALTAGMLNAGFSIFFNLRGIYRWSRMLEHAQTNASYQLNAFLRAGI